MTSFEGWMQQQGLSESSVKKYGNAISGPLTAWANANSVTTGSLSNIEDLSKFKPISSAIQKLPIFLERNSTGHGMYSSALVKFAEYLQREREATTNKKIASAEQIQVPEEDRIALANMMVGSLPIGNKRQEHDLKEGGFRIFFDGDQCAAVYFANNAPRHLIEFALDTKNTTIGEAERQAFKDWLEHQKAEFGGHDARNHKKGKQLDWFRIGVKTYSDATVFIKRITDERQKFPISVRWTIPAAIPETQSPQSIRSNKAVPAVVANAVTDTWASTALRMVKTAQQTTASSNGQVVSQTIKNKNNGFDNEDKFVDYVKALIEQQGGCCAISGLQLHADNEQADDEMKASLDRIDSSAHYEAGNLQVVCRFINRWKGADPNGQFKELLERLRQHWILIKPNQ